MRFAVGEVADDRVIGSRAEPDDGVAHLQAVGQPTGGADPDDPFGAELDELAVVDRRAGAAHPDGLHADRLALEGAGVPQHAALLVDASRPRVEERLGDVRGSAGVAGNQHRRGVVGGLGAEVNGHSFERIAVRLFAAGYLRKRDVVLSASTLPPV